MSHVAVITASGATTVWSRKDSGRFCTKRAVITPAHETRPAPIDHRRSHRVATV